MMLRKSSQHQFVGQVFCFITRMSDGEDILSDAAEFY